MIDSYAFGSMVIDGRRFTADVKIVDGEVVPGWWRKEGHSICQEDIADILVAKPEVLIIGTGAYGGLRVPERFRKLLRSEGIELIAAPTAEAVDAYNELAATKKVAAGFHLTC